MKIIVIDRDTATTQLISTRLQEFGHNVVVESVKGDAIERMAGENFDVIFIDPAPLTNARPVLLGVRRAVLNYPYIIMMSQSIDRDEALRAGANDLLLKPLEGEGLEKMVENADRLTRLIKRIGNEAEDFPSAGGVIAKSAFNQLFLSSLERADRYGERSFEVFISVSNYEEILQMEGPYAAQTAVARLSQTLVHMRRQSDIIAQTGKYEYCLMLQRPQYATEPMDAAGRFAEELSKNEDLGMAGRTAVELSITLVELPTGSIHGLHKVKPGAATRT